MQLSNTCSIGQTEGRQLWWGSRLCLKVDVDMSGIKAASVGQHCHSGGKSEAHQRRERRSNGSDLCEAVRRWWRSAIVSINAINGQHRSSQVIDSLNCRKSTFYCPLEALIPIDTQCTQCIGFILVWLLSQVVTRIDYRLSIVSADECRSDERSLLSQSSLPVHSWVGPNGESGSVQSQQSLEASEWKWQ